VSGPLFTFEAVFPDGSPRRWAGTWRPPHEDAERLYDETPHEQLITSMKHGDYASFADKNWHHGTFDRPIYFIEESERV
jgi:hypothetical protein